MDSLAPLIATSLNAAVPIMLAALGLVLNERIGVLNLGAEGMMLIAALAGFAVAFSTKSVGLGLLAGAAVGAITAAVFAAFALGLSCNQVATGLAITILGSGLSAFLGQKWVGKSLTPIAPHWGSISDLPFVGKAFFSLHFMAYLAFALAIALHLIFTRTRMGLLIRAIGENPGSAHALGYRVLRLRFFAAMVGGALCGLAGAYLSCVATPLWVEGMTAGRGWIALALTTFATWRPLRTALGALLFGAVTTLQFSLQGFGVEVPSQLLAMLPYAATIVVLVLISRRPEFIKLNMPASLGKTFRP